MAVTGNKEVVIEADPAAVLDVLSDVEALPSWSPVHKKVEIVDRTEDGKPYRVKMAVSILGVKSAKYRKIYDQFRKAQSKKVLAKRHLKLPAEG